MASPRKQIIKLIEQGYIPEQYSIEALKVTKVLPDGLAWKSFIDQVLLWLSSLALASAGMFFIAYNWDAIGRFTKFATLEVFIVLAVFAYCKQGMQSIAAKVSLLMATILLGVLLALYGQTYQTGADPWQLFFTWALMMLPWAIIGQFFVLWLVWVVLINLSIVLYHQAFAGIFGFMFDTELQMFWLVFVVNTLFWVIWEFVLSTRHWLWLSARWAIRLLAVGSGVPISLLVLHTIFASTDVSIFPVLVWMLWLGVVYFIYRKKIHDLFMLAGGCLSGLVVVISFLAKHLLDGRNSGAFLLLALLVIGLGAGVAVWLRNIHQEWQS